MRERGNLVVSNLQQQASYLADTGAADAYEVAFLDVPAAYTAGLLVIFKATNANTGASTLDVNGLGPIDIRKNATIALSSGDILTNQIIAVIYDGTNFQVIATTSGGITTLTNGNGTTANGTAVDLGGTISQNTNIDYSGFSVVFEGAGFNDSVAIYDGGIDLSVGDSNRHAHLYLAKLATGSSFQAIIDSTGNTLFGEIDGITNDVANTGMWDIYMQDTGVFYSNLLLDETGVFLRAGTTLATAKGLFIDLAGTPYLDIVGNDNTETKLLTWNSVDKKVEYRDLSSLNPTLQEVTTAGNTTSDDIILDDGGSDVWFQVKNSPSYTLPFISVGGGIGGGVIVFADADTYTSTIGTSGLTANRIINFPDSSGTVALTSDLPQVLQSRVTSQFDKTSDDVLADITGLSLTLEAGKTYRFETQLYTASHTSGGIKFAISGTATATNVIYSVNFANTTAGTGTYQATALGTTVGNVTATSGLSFMVTINGTITVNAAGTLTAQFAQNASFGTPSSILIGSTFVATEMT